MKVDIRLCKHFDRISVSIFREKSKPNVLDTKLKLNFVALVRKQTIPTERPPLVGEIIVNFADSVAWSAQHIPTVVNLGFLDPEPLLFNSSSSSVIFTRLDGPRSRLTTFQKVW
jgi:hypothetical protein